MSYVLLIVAEVLFLILFLSDGSRFFGLLGIGADDGLMLSIFAFFPILFGLAVIWARLALDVHYPHLKKTLLYPTDALKKGIVKLLTVLYLLSGLLTYSHYLNSLPSLFSISVILASLYAALVVLDVLFYLSNDERMLHPFKREYAK